MYKGSTLSCLIVRQTSGTTRSLIYVLFTSLSVPFHFSNPTTRRPVEAHSRLSPNFRNYPLSYVPSCLLCFTTFPKDFSLPIHEFVRWVRSSLPFYKTKDLTKSVRLEVQWGFFENPWVIDLREILTLSSRELPVPRTLNRSLCTDKENTGWYKLHVGIPFQFLVTQMKRSPSMSVKEFCKELDEDTPPILPSCTPPIRVFESSVLTDPSFGSGWWIIGTLELVYLIGKILSHMIRYSILIIIIDGLS